MTTILLLISLISIASVSYGLTRHRHTKQHYSNLKKPFIVSVAVAAITLIAVGLATSHQPSQSQAAKQNHVTKVKKLSTKDKKAVLATSSSLKKVLGQKQQEAKKLTKKLTKKQKTYKKQVKAESESTSIAQAKAASESQAAASSAAQSQSIVAAAQASQQAAAQQSQAAATEQTQNTVYIAPNSGRKYHNDPNCRGLSRANSVIPMSLADAQAQGYTLCGWED